MSKKKQYPIFRIYEYTGFGNLRKVEVTIDRKKVFENLDYASAIENSRKLFEKYDKIKQLVIVEAERNDSIIKKVITKSKEIKKL